MNNLTNNTKSFKAATLDKFKGDLKIKDHCFRELKSNEYLIKIMSTSILPADLALLNGLYGSSLPPLPRIFGMEGSGIIEQVGKDIDKSVLGKHCSIIANSSSPDFNGVWSQYAYAVKDNLLIYDKKVPFDTIFNSQANPLTACGFIDTIKNKHNKKSVAHTGASSAFGRMFMRLCIKEGIEVVNIVRKDSSIIELKEYGGKYFVNTSEDEWVDKLKKYCNDLDITILFDCVGGSVTGNCLKALKNKGVLYHFGNLELSRLSDIDPRDFFFNEKVFKGWWLSAWLEERSHDLKDKDLSLNTIDYWRNIIKTDFELNDGKLFGTEFKKKFDLNDIEKAFETYLTSSGKVLIKPWGLDNNE